MSKYKTGIVFTCAHAKPGVDNKRFDLLGSLIYDIRPDFVTDLGDFDDMESLHMYDKTNPKGVSMSDYEADIEIGQEARERLWHKFRYNKKKRPHRRGFEGNHEYRIKKAIEKDPMLRGNKYGISFKNLNTNYWYDEYHEYSNSAPALASYEGILYSHYIGAGNYGTAMSSKHHGYALVEKLSCSVTVGHSHKFHFFRKAEAYPNPINGLVAGCLKGAAEKWGGQANAEWTKGVAIKRYVKDGDYDLQWVSMRALEKEYG